MSPPSVHCIDELSTRDLERLAQTLNLQARTLPSPPWLLDQEASVKGLPYRLQKPASMLPRLAMALPFTEKAHLCPAHRGLNAHLVRRIFIQVSAECTTRLTRLVENPYLPHNIALFVKRLRAMNSLWMNADLFRITFQFMPDDERFERVPSECEACILATVGGNPAMLLDLRTSMLGRKKKGKHEPRLLRLVEAWLEWTAEGHVLRAVSDSLAKDVRHCRRQMQKARRQKKKNLKAGIVDTKQEKEEKEEEESAELSEREERNEHDPEGSIIDFFATRVRSNMTLDTLADAQSIHPAFRESIIIGFNTPSGSRNSLPPRPGNPTAYTDTEPSLLHHRGASARPRHAPPPAWNNNSKNKRTQPRNTAAYSESVYSGVPEGARDSDANLPQTVRRMDNSAEQAEAYLGLLRVEADGPYAPPRDGWGDAGERAPTGAQAERRETRVSDFM